MTTPLQNAIEFLREFGLFDVVLPFLLVFALIFAILEKTKILGTEKIGEDKEAPKKELNTIVAFVIAMLVVATNKVVSAINSALPNVVLIIVAFVAFLMMIGIFMGSKEFKFKEDYPKVTLAFVIISMIILILIILNSLTLESGQTWLDYLLTYVINNFSGPIVMSIIFLLVAILAIYYITKSTSGGKK